jgi:hypothetical protein
MASRRQKRFDQFPGRIRPVRLVASPGSWKHAPLATRAQQIKDCVDDSAHVGRAGEMRHELERALQMFNQELPANKHVRLLDKRGHWISLSPLVQRLKTYFLTYHDLS